MRAALTAGFILTAWAACAVPAFPGAEGAGAGTPGGRGGRVIAVTSLADAGPGSFREACSQEGARTIVFAVGGVIDLESAITITNGRLTVAGQTAPGDGICLRGAGLTVKADDVILRYLRIRPGDVLNDAVDGISVYDSRRVIIDHCSVSWAVDEGLTVTGASDEVSIQWCIVSECLHDSVHQKGPHSMGSLVRSEKGVYSFHYNLYAHNNTRNPRPGDNYDGSQGVLLDFRNHVIYNWGGACGYGVDERYRMNYVANYLKPGPSTKAMERKTAFHIGGKKSLVYVQGNVIDGFPESEVNDRSILAWAKEFTPEERDATVVSTAFPVPEVTTQTAAEARRLVLENAGATRPKRDAVDARVVDAVGTGGGSIINSQKDVGGWPDYPAASGPADGDGDGMPDAWEYAHGLNPADGSDGPLDGDSDGYTNLEVYLNALAE